MKLQQLLFLCILAAGCICTAATEVIAQSSTGSLSGRITNEQGEPVPGATIQPENQNEGAVTDLNGNYAFETLNEGSYIFIIRSIGFETRRIEAIINAGEETRLDVMLQSSDIMLDDLLVTAQKREQSIQNVPITISSLTGEFLQQTNVQEFDAFSSYVPGLEVQIQSVNNPGFVVRGITSDSGDSRIEPRVSVFKDGVSISKSRGSIVELHDVERVEVLKGPQGTLFGRGAQIGAVHIIQNKPTNIFSGAITSGFGSENERLVRGFVNVPIIQDRLFSRVALLYNEREGFIENISGGNLNGKDTFAGRVSLRYLPDDRTIIDLIGNYQYDNPPGTSFKSGTYAPAGGSVDPTSTADMERGNDLYIDRTVWDITLLGERVLSDRWELNSITAYREFDSYESFDADGTAAPVLWFAEDAYGQQFSQELRLNFDNDKSFRGFMGTSYFWEDGYQRVPFETDERSFFALLSPFLADFGVPFIPLITPDGQVNQPVQVNPLTGQPLKEFHAEENTNFGTLSAYEIFADGSFDLTPRLTLTAGLRFTYEDVTGAQETPVADTPGTLGQVLGAGSNNLFVPTEGKLSRSETFTSLVGRLNASYEFSESTNLFGNISRGRRPNVINVTASGSTVLDEEIVWSYEAGVKQLAFNNSLAIDLSGFYYDYSNFQTSVTELTDDGLVAEARDTGEATAYGLETSLRYNLNRNISFFGSYGYTDATIDDEDSDGNPQELAGNRFRLTPEHSFALGGSFRANINPSVGIFIDPSYTWKSEVFFEEDNDPEIREDAYGLLNLRAGASFYNERLELAFYGKNLLDHAYIIDAGNTGGAFGIPTFIAGPPRLIGLQITGRF